MTEKQSEQTTVPKHSLSHLVEALVSHPLTDWEAVVSACRIAVALDERLPPAGHAVPRYGRTEVPAAASRLLAALFSLERTDSEDDSTVGVALDHPGFHACMNLLLRFRKSPRSLALLGRDRSLLNAMATALHFYQRAEWRDDISRGSVLFQTQKEVIYQRYHLKQPSIHIQNLQEIYELLWQTIKYGASLPILLELSVPQLVAAALVRIPLQQLSERPSLLKYAGMLIGDACSGSNGGRQYSVVPHPLLADSISESVLPSAVSSARASPRTKSHRLSPQALIGLAAMHMAGDKLPTGDSPVSNRLQVQLARPDHWVGDPCRAMQLKLGKPKEVTRLAHHLALLVEAVEHLGVPDDTCAGHYILSLMCPALAELAYAFKHVAAIATSQHIRDLFHIVFIGDRHEGDPNTRSSPFHSEPPSEMELSEHGGASQFPVSPATAGISLSSSTLNVSRIISSPQVSMFQGVSEPGRAAYGLMQLLGPTITYLNSSEIETVFWSRPLLVKRLCDLCLSGTFPDRHSRQRHLEFLAYVCIAYFIPQTKGEEPRPSVVDLDRALTVLWTAFTYSIHIPAVITGARRALMILRECPQTLHVWAHLLPQGIIGCRPRPRAPGSIEMGTTFHTDWDATRLAYLRGVLLGDTTRPPLRADDCGKLLEAVHIEAHQLRSTTLSQLLNLPDIHDSIQDRPGLDSIESPQQNTHLLRSLLDSSPFALSAPHVALTVPLALGLGLRKPQQQLLAMQCFVASAIRFGGSWPRRLRVTLAERRRDMEAQAGLPQPLLALELLFELSTLPTPSLPTHLLLTCTDRHGNREESEAVSLPEPFSRAPETAGGLYALLGGLVGPVFGLSPPSALLALVRHLGPAAPALLISCLLTSLARAKAVVSQFSTGRKRQSHQVSVLNKAVTNADSDLSTGIQHATRLFSMLLETRRPTDRMAVELARLLIWLVVWRHPANPGGIRNQCGRMLCSALALPHEREPHRFPSHVSLGLLSTRRSELCAAIAKTIVPAEWLSEWPSQLEMQRDFELPWHLRSWLLPGRSVGRGIPYSPLAPSIVARAVGAFGIHLTIAALSPVIGSLTHSVSNSTTVLPYQLTLLPTQLKELLKSILEELNAIPNTAKATESGTPIVEWLIRDMCYLARIHEFQDCLLIAAGIIASLSRLTPGCASTALQRNASSFALTLSQQMHQKLTSGKSANESLTLINPYVESVVKSMLPESSSPSTHFTTWMEDAAAESTTHPLFSVIETIPQSCGKMLLTRPPALLFSILSKIAACPDTRGINAVLKMEGNNTDCGCALALSAWLAGRRRDGPTLNSLLHLTQHLLQYGGTHSDTRIHRIIGRWMGTTTPLLLNAVSQVGLESFSAFSSVANSLLSHPALLIWSLYASSTHMDTSGLGTIPVEAKDRKARGLNRTALFCSIIGRIMGQYRSSAAFSSCVVQTQGEHTHLIGSGYQDIRLIIQPRRGRRAWDVALDLSEIDIETYSIK
eukprot:gnl/Dysnectes_brevis/4880_a6773_457.p1 GENE.gnl/Dysnectes_brevis/4880_a6773_457~~gnl/Dysnectes_brevis/4880_a6773_457.p1  ORF type:complete len:1482 (+),score=93.46 gnl/Dysnectes_brevis/4880_a6773_457:85-4530(+)